MIIANMNPVFDFLIEPYTNYEVLDIFLEVLGVFLGLLSVWFAKRDHISVYPTGMLSTAIFVYILFKANLLGDMLINAYFFIMSIYGWYFWGQKEGDEVLNPIGKINKKEINLGVLLFAGSVLFVIVIYILSNKWNNLTAPIDAFTTAVFFVSMWLMARRKIEHWILWIIGDLISIPLYLFKGLLFTSIQYLIFTLIAIFGYIQWKRSYNSKKQIV